MSDTNNLLRLPKVMEITGLARSTLYLRIRQGLMTPPIKHGERCSAWPTHEVLTINAAHIAGRPIDEIRSVVSRLRQERTSMAEMWR